MGTPVTPTVQRRRLGELLKSARIGAGKTREQAAELLTASVATISRVETGRSGIRLLQLRALMDFYGLTDADEREEMEALAKSGSQQGWWASSKQALKTSYQTYIGLEQAASDMLTFETVNVPGLLQTEAYARELFTHLLPRLDPETIEHRVTVRMERQHRLLAGGMYLSVVLDEAAILRQVGGRATWQQQLDRLVKDAERPNVTVQVLPFEIGAHPGSSSFVVLRFPDDPDVAYVEQPTGGDLFYDGEEAARYVAMHEALRALALPAPMSIARIRTLIDQR